MQPEHADRSLSPRDWWLGTGFALVLATGFVHFSPGRALWVTFVPGVGFAWLLFARFRSRALPAAGSVLPLYYACLAVQVLHFLEEWAGGFAREFPPLYGGEPFSTPLFVAFNAIAYVVFALAAPAALGKSLGFLWLPALFFVGYGTLGNAVAHLTWSLHAAELFPGVWTAAIHAVLGPLLLRRILGSWWVVFLYALPFSAILVALLLLGLEAGA